MDRIEKSRRPAYGGFGEGPDEGTKFASSEFRLTMPSPSTKKNLGLMLLGGALLGLSYPPLHLGLLGVIAFLPFFVLFEDITGYGKALRSAYGFIFVFNLITLYWPGGFTHHKDLYMMLAGLAVILFHPVFFLITIPPFIFIRKRFGYRVAVLIFPFIWVAFEYLHSLTEYSFPWVLLGNTQSYNLPAIQMASITGIYGISFWLMCLNVSFYFLYSNLVRGRLKIRSSRFALHVAGLILLYSVVVGYGWIVLGSRPDTEIASTSSLKVGLVQPNIDPFDKWTYPAETQIAILESLTVEAAKQGAELVIWPETAIPTYMLQPRHAVEFAAIRHRVDSLGIYLLTGVADIHFYPENGPAPRSAMTAANGRKYDSYNSTMLVPSGLDSVQLYHKIHLVPYAERVPYSDLLSFMNAMQWNFGLGGWGIGKDTTIFRFHDKRGREYLFSNAICFESVYPGFVAEFVKKGAQFITVTTNDSWWGNTSGVYQHRQIGIMRAVENRRWVAQDSDGGITCTIDPYGYVHNESAFKTRDIVVATIEPSHEMTFYTLHGDWLAQACLVLSACFVGAAAGKKTYDSIRAKENL